MTRLARLFQALCLVPALVLSIAPFPVLGDEEAETTATRSSPRTQTERLDPSRIGQGSLMFRSAVSGGFEEVPLKHTDVEIDVRGLVASATVTQRYENAGETPVEAIYVFPLPAKAAVFDLEIRIGDRVIHSVIKERAEAKRTYEKARSEGRRAALLEQERPNIFTASVANILPKDVIDVRLRYVEALAWEGGRVRLVFPMVVGPRFIPGETRFVRRGSGWAPDTDAVPDASRITPPMRHPDARPGHDIALTVSVDLGIGLAEVASPSHPIRVSPAAGGPTSVQLADEAVLPNRDFVLNIAREDSRVPQTALFVSKGAEESHFMLVAFPPSVSGVADRPPLEILFLIDISGSMEGTSIQQAKEALLQGLDRLRPGDRFNVVAFDNVFEGFRPEPVPATVAELDACRSFVRKLAARGGTMMLPALEHVMAMTAAPGHLRYIVVLTDGDLGNEEQIFASLRSRLGDARLFTVAIGSAPNHFLATKMAEFGRGTFTHIAQVSEVREQMGRFLDTIESPVLAGLGLEWLDAKVTDLFPSRAPDLFLARPLVIFGRIAGGAPGRLRLTGRMGAGMYDRTLPIDLRTARPHPGITTLWARAKVEELTDSWRTSQQGPERAAKRDEIIHHAIRHNLVTRFTSLVAVEEVIVNPSGAARQAVVPTELPAGWHLDKVFGQLPRTGTADPFLELLGLFLLAAGATWWFFSPRPAEARRCLPRLWCIGAAIALAGASLTARAAVLRIKVVAARVLIARAWARTLVTGQPVRPWAWADCDPIARLSIPSLGYREVVLRGGNPRALAFGPTHLSSSARPGDAGNVVLAGHRTSWFLPLEGIRLHDLLVLEWPDARGTRRREYRVEEVEVVDPADLRFVAPTSTDVLTLVTCYPFGSQPTSPQRFVVRAAAVN